MAYDNSLERPNIVEPKPRGILLAIKTENTSHRRVSRVPNLFAVVETPKHSRNKDAFNFELSVFELRRGLPRGMEFPYDFGFVPSIEGDDGYAFDVLRCSRTRSATTG